MPSKAESSPRVVIVHDFTTEYAGSERVIAAAARAFPDAPFWTIAGRRAVAERMGVGDRFFTLLPRRERLLRHHKALAPIYPAVVRARRLPAADVLLTSSYAFAHGLATENDAPQVCYCYTPPRFAWSMRDEYGETITRSPLGTAAYGAFTAAIRSLDRRAAKRVTRYVAESRIVADRIRRFYGVPADVVYPPVDCELFRPSENGGRDDYFLFCGRLIEPYKRPGIVIEAFRDLSRSLVVAGDGPAYRQLREAAGPNVTFVGHLSDDELVPLMQRSAAVIFPSVDDFGLVPVESMACGRPVLAYAEGGATETVVRGKTGELFPEQSAEAIRVAVESFDPDAYDPGAIRSHAEAWDEPRFRDRLRAIVIETAEGRSDPTGGADSRR
jgi:glycosyltransferase involved in cell wall biosynthesis